MARIIMTLLGLALFTLGLWLSITWWPAVKVVLLGVLALLVLLLGLGLLVFGVSEIAGARAAKKHSDDAGGAC